MNVTAPRLVSVTRVPGSAGATTRLRRGYLAVHQHAAALRGRVTLAAGRLERQVSSLLASIEGELHHAVKLAMAHPTLTTLGTCFDVVDEVRRRVRAVRRAERSASSGPDDVAPTVALVIRVPAILAGLDSIDQGLETIELLPPAAPDVPED